MPTPSSPATDPKKLEGQEGKPPADKPIEAESPSAKFLQELVGGVTPKPAAKPKADADAGDGDAGADGGQKPAPKPAAKKKAAAPPAPVATAIDEAKLGEAIGKSIAKHTAEAPKTEKNTPSPADEKEARKLATFERMERLNGELYKGITERYKASKAELRKYAAEWEKANPGEKFDPDAEEHESVIQELEDKFDYDDEDYTLALADLLRQKLEGGRTPREEQLEERLTEIERAERARTKSGEIAEVASAAANECWKIVGGEIAKAVKDDGSLDADAINAINDSDPVKYAILYNARAAAANGAALIHKLANHLEKNDLSIAQHAAINKFCYEQEQKMLTRNPEDQVVDGKTFCTSAQFSLMTPDQRARHWVMSTTDFEALWALEMAKAAKKDLDDFDEKIQLTARARRWIPDDEKAEAKPDKPARRRAQADEDVADDELSDNGKPQSPSFSVSPKTAGGKPGGGSGAKTGLERFVNPFLA